MEFAWPEEEAAKTNRRLHVALTFIRKLLEPDLKRGLPSAYLLRQGSGYRLETGTGGSVDVLTFRREIETARRKLESPGSQALGALKNAVALYRGALFEEDPYEEGFHREREMLQSQYLWALESLLRQFEAEQAWDLCVEHAERYLTADPYAERIYCGLMRYHSHRHDGNQVTGVFQRCKHYISQDLGLILSPHTEALYHKLVAGGAP
jgi:DNA-binding SARP family transcriptional activator